MSLTRVYSCLFIAIVSSFASKVEAQDSHYWSHQFGTRSALLGGAVVGSVNDTSAGFYNPGALGFIDNESLSVSANAFRYETISIDNGAGTGDDLDSDEVQVIPLLVSGIFRFEDLPDHTFGYTILTRNSDSQSYSDRRDSVTDVLSIPGPEDFVGQFTFDSDISEYWGGLSWAHEVSSGISVGLTNFLAIRSEEHRSTIQNRAINQQFPSFAATTDVSNLIDYDNLRILWKAGVQADFSPVKLGLVVTTPSINIYGDGTSAADVTLNGVDFDGDGLADPLIASDRQDDLDAEYRTPFSVAGGAQFDISDGTRLHTTVEWFTSQGAYNVMVPDARDFLRPSGTEFPGSEEFLLVQNGAEAVVNWAVGLEQDLSEKVTGFASLRSDYETVRADDISGTSLGVSKWDIYHATVGATYKQEHSELGIGVVYSFGETDNFTQAVNLSNPAIDNFLVGVPENTSVDYDAVSVILGYTYYLR